MIAVSLSGGLDSTVLATLAARTGGRVIGCSFDYGQTHRRELASARAVADSLGIRHRTIDIRGLLAGSALLGNPDSIPEGHYAEANMAATVVHGRNLIFAAALVPIAGEYGEIWAGVHAGDHPVYPDCRPDFWNGVQRAVDAYAVAVKTPFIDKTKAEIVIAGAALRAPVELSWSCYKGGDRHCGRCGTCVERAEAFALANVPDPTEYADSEFWKGATV
jgi:7-cyano-7-deazaguanine synthase